MKAFREKNGDITIENLEGGVNIPSGIHELIEYGYTKEQAEKINSEATAYVEAIEEAARKKTAIKKALSAITVKFDHKDGELEFDANTESRNLMSQAILSAKTLGITQTPWKMADNTVRMVSLDDLNRAIAEGISKHGAIVLS